MFLNNSFFRLHWCFSSLFLVFLHFKRSPARKGDISPWCHWRHYGVNESVVARFVSRCMLCVNWVWSSDSGGSQEYSIIVIVDGVFISDQLTLKGMSFSYVHLIVICYSILEFNTSDLSSIGFVNSKVFMKNTFIQSTVHRTETVGSHVRHQINCRCIKLEYF
jgi:hypothetical protein